MSATNVGQKFKIYANRNAPIDGCRFLARSVKGGSKRAIKGPVRAGTKKLTVVHQYVDRLLVSVHYSVFASLDVGEASRGRTK